MQGPREGARFVRSQGHNLSPGGPVVKGATMNNNSLRLQSLVNNINNTAQKSHSSHSIQQPKTLITQSIQNYLQTKSITYIKPKKAPRKSITAQPQKPKYVLIS